MSDLGVHLKVYGISLPEEIKFAELCFTGLCYFQQFYAQDFCLTRCNSEGARKDPALLFRVDYLGLSNSRATS